MGIVASNSACGLSDPKMLGQICQMVNDDKKKVGSAAFETLWLILSKDSSTAIILNSYLDPQVYNSISERWLSGILATVNYDGIVEFPTLQISNSNHLLYRSGYSNDPDSENKTKDKEEIRKHTQSADHSYAQNFQAHSKLNVERHNNPNNPIEFDKTNSTTQSIGNKMWLPGFNMTASSIKSEQSVRVSQEPYMQTPNQYYSKANNLSDIPPHERFEQKMNFTPEIHQSKPRTFGNINNPSMTTHSMNAAPGQATTLQHHATDSTRSNTFYSRDTISKDNQNISDKLKILKSSSKMKSNHSPISHQEIYNDQISAQKVSTLSDYNPTRMNEMERFSTEKKTTERVISGAGPIKATEFSDLPIHSTLKTEISSSGIGDFDDNLSDTKHHRYSQHTNKSLESRNRSKNSFSQK